MARGKRFLFFTGFCFVLAIALAGCKERFEPNLPSVTTGYLVVEGIVNSTGPGQLKLSRTVPLTSQKRNQQPELKAQVQIEAQNNRLISFSETGQGVYTLPNLNLDPAVNYRLRIKTAAGQEYISEFVPVNKTPNLDNIDWEEINNGVQVYVNTHDPGNNTRYYKWEYEETWEYISQERTNLKWNGSQVVPRLPTEEVYRCWGQGGSNNIILGSSAKLTQDIIYRQPLVFIPMGSVKLNQVYSILVKQSALTREAYDFLQTMRKNTETLGSFFDPQPSEIKGNIRNVTNPAEPVIGFFTIGNIVEKRIFIARTELKKWEDTRYECRQHLVVNHPDSMKWYFDGLAPIPYPKYTDPITGGLVDQTKPCCKYIPVERLDGGWRSVIDVCADCTTRGGKTIKPDFWP